MGVYYKPSMTSKLDEIIKNQLTYKIKFILQINSPFYNSLLEWLINHPINPSLDLQVINLYNKEFNKDIQQSQSGEQQLNHLNEQILSTQFQLKSYLNNNLKESIRVS